MSEFDKGINVGVKSSIEKIYYLDFSEAYVVATGEALTGIFKQICRKVDLLAQRETRAGYLKNPKPETLNKMKVMALRSVTSIMI